MPIMPYCCAYGCSNRSDQATAVNDERRPHKITYHKIPCDPKRQKEWLGNIRRENFTPSKHSTLCSDHFEDWCFDRTGSTVRVRENAVPTIFSFSSKSKTVRKQIRKVDEDEDDDEPPCKRTATDTNRTTIKKEKGVEIGALSSGGNDLTPILDIGCDIEIKNEVLDDEESSMDLNLTDDSMYDVTSPVTKPEPRDRMSPVLASGQSKKQTKGMKKKTVANSEHGSESTGEDRVRYLSNDLTCFEFATPKKNLVLQIKAPKSNCELRINNLEEILSSLRSMQLISHNLQTLLEAFGELPEEIEKVSNGKTTSKEHAESVQKFSSVLFTYAPKAYNLLSTAFRLPGTEILRARLRAIDYWPGFTEESLDILARKMRKCKTNADKMCSIMFESIDIRKQHSYDGFSNRWIGHIDFGGGPSPDDSDDIPLASEILIFTAVGLGSNWKLPFGYFLNKGLTGEELKSLVTEAILALENCGLIVNALVCDGCVSTIKMGQLLGCNVHSKLLKEMITSFTHPKKEKQKIYLVFGIHQAFSQLQCLLKNKGTLRSSTYGNIKWKYFEQLYSSSDWGNSDNNEISHMVRLIKLGNQGFNQAVSNALMSADGSNLEGYTGCTATANFSADISRAHDLLTSRNPSSEMNPPLNQAFVAEQLEAMSIISQRVFDLQSPSGTPIAQEGHWISTTLLPFTLKSIANLAAELFNGNVLTCLPTYRLSLEHSTVIRKCIQRRVEHASGTTSTLTAEDFRNGYKMLVNESQNICSHSAQFNNDFEGEDLTVGQRSSCSLEKCLKMFQRDDLQQKYFCITDYGMYESVLAKLIIKSISQKLSCTECIDLMLAQKDSVDRNVNNISPSSLMLQILAISERLVKFQLLKSCSVRDEHLVLLIFQTYCGMSGRLTSFDIDHLNEEPHHVICLIKVIIRTFLKYRLQNTRQLLNIRRSLTRNC